MNKKNITFIIFGASGDLAKRKLIPALFSLFLKQEYNFLFIGVGKEKRHVKDIFDDACNFIKNSNSIQYTEFLERFFYYSFDIFDTQESAVFSQHIQEIEHKMNFTESIHIAYCATPAHLFIPITKLLSNTKLIRNTVDHDFDSIVYEKPFGNSKKDAQEINTVISEHFKEQQIFRVDHYLTKELVQAIFNIRFSNTLFESLLNNQHVEEVQIIANEEIGIEGRGFYYDQYGAIKDMVQNHLLSLLSLISFEKKEGEIIKNISQKKQEILKDIMFDDGILGQCENYQEEIGKKSKTETFAALTFFINNARWKNVPFFVKTGKYLEKKETVIYITFKDPHTAFKNILTLKIAPEAIFSLSLNIRAPGKKNIISVPLEFCHSCIFAAETPESYEILLQEVLLRDHSITVSREEIETGWEVTEQIVQKNLPIFSYKKGSKGPGELKDFEEKYHMQWKG